MDLLLIVALNGQDSLECQDDDVKGVAVPPSMAEDWKENKQKKVKQKKYKTVRTRNDDHNVVRYVSLCS